jgi:tetratricopeptide (TPR) repeat protein
MSSIISGFNYDVFISYRQKDNKHDGWVTEFVNNLKGELESTFKEEISVYFDINPHDGLLETHDVDESLKEKLKCLLFIPIISRTYCDPKSFAWEHEFKAFVEQASKDQFGLRVRLPNGNVASRVLPVRIHDLDADDIKECELVLGSVLRGIEFIYKEPGVDKPLAAGDNEKKNLNNTVYRIQIIKVAHAVREIISGMKAEPVAVVKNKVEHEENVTETDKHDRKDLREKPARSKMRKRPAIAIMSVVLLAVTAMIFYPWIFKNQRLQKLQAEGKISVAVMPFHNMTNDTVWNVWQSGIQDILMTSLSNSSELIVRQTEAVNSMVHSGNLNNYASLTPSIAGNISRKLDATVFIYGNIKKAGNTVRVSAQLIDSKTNQIFQSFQIEGSSAEEKVFQITDSLSAEIRKSLLISILKQGQAAEVSLTETANSPEAYRYLIYGLSSFAKIDYTSARSFFAQALAIDSNLTTAIVYTAASYANQKLYEQAKQWCLRAYGKRDQMTAIQKLYTNWQYSNLFETPHEEIRYLQNILKIDDQYTVAYYLLGWAYYQLFQYDKAIPEYEKSLGMTKKRDIKPFWVYSYTELGYSYHKCGEFRKEKKLYKIAERDFPDDKVLLYNQAILALSTGKIKDADGYIEKYKSIRRENSVSEADLASSLGNLYWDAGILDKTEEYFRQALSLEPENPSRLNGLAWFLIDNEKNIDEGMGLINKALESAPEDYNYLDTKGWGLYKQGNYQEALAFLQKSWDLLPVYDHEVYLHLEAAKKALAGQKDTLSI